MDEDITYMMARAYKECHNKKAAILYVQDHIADPLRSFYSAEMLALMWHCIDAYVDLYA